MDSLEAAVSIGHSFHQGVSAVDDDNHVTKQLMLKMAADRKQRDTAKMAG